MLAILFAIVGQTAYFNLTLNKSVKNRHGYTAPCSSSSGAWNVRRNADTDSDINKENDLARRTADTDSDTDKEDDQIRMY